MSEVTTIGLDLAKNVFQVHGADGSGHAVIRKKLRRDQVLSFFSQMPPCLVAMEACGGAHFWGREIGKLGHEVRLIPPAYVKPFVKRQKNDAADAEAICEAAQRPSMRFVPAKSEATQGAAMVFRVRELLIRQRTQAINALRGHLAEFGAVVPQGAANAARLVALVEDQSSGLPDDARGTLEVLVGTLAQLDAQIAKFDAEIARRAKESDVARRLMTVLAHYRERGKAEGHMGELKDVLAPALSSTNRAKSHWRGKKPKSKTPAVDAFACNEVRLLIACLAYQVMHVARRAMAEATGTGWSLRRLRERVLRAGARLVISARRMTLVLSSAAAPFWASLWPRLMALQWADP